MDEYETIIEETLDSIYDDISTKEEHDQVVEACKNALQRAKEKRKEFIENNDDDDEDLDEDLDDDE